MTQKALASPCKDRSAINKNPHTKVAYTIQNWCIRFELVIIIIYSSLPTISEINDDGGRIHHHYHELMAMGQ